jgi:hypothetical protein
MKMGREIVDGRKCGCKRMGPDIGRDSEADTLMLMSMSLCAELRELPPLFSGEVFVLCVSQHLRQLGISAVIGQHEDHL